MIVVTDDLVPLARAALPGNPHVATRWRWATKGVRGTILETIVCGGQRFTSADAIRRFLDAQNLPGAIQFEPTAAATLADVELQRRGC